MGYLLRLISLTLFLSLIYLLNSSKSDVEITIAARPVVANCLRFHLDDFPVFQSFRLPHFRTGLKNPLILFLNVLQGGAADSISTSQLQGPRFNPEQPVTVLCVKFLAMSSVGFLWVYQFSPFSQKHAGDMLETWWIGCTKLSQGVNVCMYLVSIEDV